MNIVRGDIIHGGTLFTPTTAIACCCSLYFLALGTLYFLWLFHLLKGISDVKQMMNVKSRLEVSYSSRWGEEGGASAGGAAYGDLSLLVLEHQSLQAFLAVDVETVEQFWLFKGF